MQVLLLIEVTLIAVGLNGIWGVLREIRDALRTANEQRQRG